MRTLSFKVDDADEAAIRWRMEKGGDKSLSAYLRRASLGSYDIDRRLNLMQKQMAKLTEALERQQRMLNLMLDSHADEVQLKLLADIHEMISTLVDPAARAMLDEGDDAEDPDHSSTGEHQVTDGIGKNAYLAGRKRRG